MYWTPFLLLIAALAGLYWACCKVAGDADRASDDEISAALRGEG